MKIVFDTNIYLAATKTGSYMNQQLLKCAPGLLNQLYISPQIILEVQDKLLNKFFYSHKETALYVSNFMEYAMLVYPTQKIVGVLNDADDHIILECAVEAKADAIFTSDKGLLKLKEFRGIKICHPQVLSGM